MTISFRRIGGLYHWRIGRIGGSFYLASRNRRPAPERRRPRRPPPTSWRAQMILAGLAT